jgi:dephospho-CoA kinase
MAVDQIKPVVGNFVARGSNQVLVLKGNWGIGKTHFWSRLIDKHVSKEKVEIGKPKYSYVSLFGVDSLEDVKRSIFTSVVDTSTLRKGRTAGALRNLQGRARELAEKVSDIPKVAEWGGSAVVEKILFDGVENTLVCIDDLERRGGGMEIRDLLGLASMLKEERNCQVVLILNDDALRDDARKEFSQYGEKLIDLEVEFERTPEEAFSCVFDEDDEFSNSLFEGVRQLEIRNVRIIQRLKRLSQKLKPYLDECEPQTRKTALKTLVLLVWCYYGEEEQSPSMEHLQDHGRVYSQLTGEELTDDEGGEWAELLRDYGYAAFEDLDRVLLNLIEKGYLTQEELQQQIDKIDEQARSQEARNKLREAWSLYRNSFESNEEEFVSELTQAVHNTLDYISIVNLDNAVEMLRTLRRDEAAEDLIEAYVSRHRDEPAKLDLDEIAWSRDVEDQQLREKLNAAVEEVKEEKSLTEVLKRVSSGSSWGGSDKAFVAQASSDEYYKSLKHLQGEELHNSVEWCLSQGELSNADEQDERIYRKASMALLRIAKESELNRVRLTKMHGVDLEELSSRV